MNFDNSISWSNLHKKKIKIKIHSHWTWIFYFTCVYPHYLNSNRLKLKLILSLIIYTLRYVFFLQISVCLPITILICCKVWIIFSSPHVWINTTYFLQLRIFSRAVKSKLFCGRNDKKNYLYFFYHFVVSRCRHKSGKSVKLINNFFRSQILLISGYTWWQWWQWRICVKKSIDNFFTPK